MELMYIIITETAIWMLSAVLVVMASNEIKRIYNEIGSYQVTPRIIIPEKVLLFLSLLGAWIPIRLMCLITDYKRQRRGKSQFYGNLKATGLASILIGAGVLFYL